MKIAKITLVNKHNAYIIIQLYVEVTINSFVKIVSPVQAFKVVQ